MTDFWLGFVIVFVWLFAIVFGYSIGQESLTQQLCSKQQYDFCEVKETIYKIKELKQDD